MYTCLFSAIIVIALYILLLHLLAYLPEVKTLVSSHKNVVHRYTVSHIFAELLFWAKNLATQENLTVFHGVEYKNKEAKNTFFMFQPVLELMTA